MNKIFFASNLKTKKQNLCWYLNKVALTGSAILAFVLRSLWIAKVWCWSGLVVTKLKTNATSLKASGSKSDKSTAAQFQYCSMTGLILAFVSAIIAYQGKPNDWILAFVWNSCLGLVGSKGKRFKCTDPHTNVPPGRHPADARVCKGEFTPGGTLVQGCRTPSASSREHRSEGLRE